MDHLSEDLERLELEARRPRRRGSQPEPYDSWFEVDVALELLRRKYVLRPQVEIAGHPIDLVVDGMDARLAVECDGDEWHGTEQYERDMAITRRLDRAGWSCVRVRESDFYVDRESATKAITDACDELGIYPVDRVEVAVTKISVPGLTADPDADASNATPVQESPSEGNGKGTETDMLTLGLPARWEADAAPALQETLHAHPEIANGVSPSSGATSIRHCRLDGVCFRYKG